MRKGAWTTVAAGVTAVGWLVIFPPNMGAG
jgi:hypothetical protein